MTETTNIGATHSEPKVDKCDWNGCKKNHTQPEPYKSRNEAEIERRRIHGYHPNMYGKFGEQFLDMVFPYRAESMGGNRRWHYNYRYQVHHVLPGNMLETFPKLFGNLYLLGWDFNNFDNNGISLPMYDADIVWHDLQPHFTSHPKYDTLVRELLDPLNEECADYCDNSEKDDKSLKKQEDLLTEINDIIVNLRECIINWDRDYILMTCPEYRGKKRESRDQVFKDRSSKKMKPVYPYRKWK